MIHNTLKGLFLVLFAFWFAADSYVGMGPAAQSFAKPLLYIVMTGLLLASAFRTLRERRLAWQTPAFAVFAVIAAQIIWRDVIHQMSGAEFKLYAVYLFDATVAIMVLGCIIMVFEWSKAIAGQRAL